MAIVVAAALVLAYITLGGLSSAIYNEVLQFFVILAGLIPLVVVGLHDMGGWSGLSDKVAANKSGGEGFLHAWQGTGSATSTNPLGATGSASCSGSGFVLSFGYWTTNFAEVQRALSAQEHERRPAYAADRRLPEDLHPGADHHPGPDRAGARSRSSGADKGDFTYNNAIPLLIEQYLPNGVLGIAVTGLLAAFMAGMAANVSSFNTVFTYDIWQTYIRQGPRRRLLPADRPGRHRRRHPDRHRHRVHRRRLQQHHELHPALFSFFNAPLFATFIIGMFWKRMTAWAGFWALLGGTLGARRDLPPATRPDVADVHDRPGGDLLGRRRRVRRRPACWRSVVSMVTQPKPDDELQGLVRGVGATDLSAGELVGDSTWYRNPLLLGGIALGISVAALHPVLVTERRSMADDSSREPPATATPRSRAPRRRSRSAARLFDIRRIIGGLFTLYGVLVLGAGLVRRVERQARRPAASTSTSGPASAMLLLGLGMLVWMRLRPVDVRAVQHDDLATAPRRRAAAPRRRRR